MIACSFCSMNTKFMRYGVRQSKTIILGLTSSNFIFLSQISFLKYAFNISSSGYFYFSFPVYICKLILYLFSGRRDIGFGGKNILVALSSQDLMKRAARVMTEKRRQRSEEDMEILIPRTCPNPWRYSGPLEKENLMSSYVGRRPVMGQGNDSQCMTNFMTKVIRDGVQFPSSVRIHEFLPAGAPLLDFLAVSMDRLESWKLPPREEIKFYQRARGLSYDMLQDVRVEEIVVGESSTREIDDVIKFFWDNWCKDQRMLPTQTCSMDNEEVRLTLYDVYRLSGRIQCEFPRLASDRIENERFHGLPEDRWMQVPVKMMLGNGMSWAVMITILIEMDKKDRYVLKQKLEIQDNLLKFLGEIPLCTGLGVRTDVTDIEYFFSLFSGSKVVLTGFIDLTSLAVLSGYNMRAMSMTPMGVNVVGHTLNKCASTGDGKWSWRWKDIPDPLKIYALGDLLFGHISYAVLSSILIRDVFPDPDVVNRCLGVTDHWFSTAWIMELIAFSLDGVEVHNVDFDSARTRTEMIKSLRFRYSESSTLMHESPVRVMLWCKLIGGWPSLSSGGCRFVHQAREKFVDQIAVLKKSGFKWTIDVKMKEMGPRFESYVRFGISKEVIDACNFSEPVPFQFGMFRPRSMKVPSIRMDPEKIKPYSLGKFCKMQTRGVKAVVFEWARINPNKIKALISRLSNDPNFRKFYYGVYQGLRLIYKRLFNSEAPRIPDLDQKFLHNIQENLKKEEELKVKSWEIYQSREARCRHLSEVLKGKGEKDDTLCLAELPKLPEWKCRRNGRKRKRSRSRSKSCTKKLRMEDKKVDMQGVNKEKKDKVIRREPESEEEDLAQVVVVEIEEEDDLFTPEINDPKPECRKVIPDKKKVKKGRKGKNGKKPATRVLSYDEIIETREYHGSDEEYGFECNFSGHLA